MEKSIENIWKEGFLKGEALVAPKVNDLYNRKSVYIIDKFMRMFRINIWAIVAGSFLLLVVSYFMGALLAGAVLFITLMSIAYSAKEEMKALAQLNMGQSSYTYLSSFQNWVEGTIEKYGKLYRFVYPIIILSFYFGMWFSDHFESTRLEVAESSEALFFGMHLYTTILVVVLAVLMGVFAKAIHRKDVQFVYGGIMVKLDEALLEMEELRGKEV